MIAAQIPPEVANQKSMQASAGSLSCLKEDWRVRLARAARDICVIPVQGRIDLNRPETKEALILRFKGVPQNADKGLHCGLAR
ncbi:hypothetical protein [Hyphococcus sp.]|jgi:hypothetical protein|uniref:hypothetical protein n=1 Tax=Hyphococcus sp. TaxID=2038636 RepID=UPI003D149A89